jgi:nucleotide-binding universal stress UspA family protein
VIAAWSPRRESARALRDALPLLRAARRVELLRYLHHGEEDRGSTEATAAWLLAHGVRAYTRLEHLAAPALHERLWHVSTVDVPIADALLSHAADAGADLVVMGGYGHARAWELAMGGVTRTVLQTMTVPVLMSH